MTTARSTQGYTVAIDAETALGTPAGAAKDIRLEEAPTIPTDTVTLERQPNLGQENVSSQKDPPLPYESAREGAITLPITPRRGATTQTPPLIRLLESGGWLLSQTADTDLATYVGVDDFTTTDELIGAGTDYYGIPLLIELDNGNYYPCLAAKYAGATNTITPMMDLPSASSATNLVKRMHTATVFPRQVPTTKTLTIAYQGRGDYTTAPDLGVTMGGCALADIGEIAVTRDGRVMISPTLHCADVDIKADALNADDHMDGNVTDATYSQPISRQESSLFRFEFGDYAAAGGITASCLQLVSATFRPNITTVFIEGYGCTATLNGIQGYMCTVAQPEVELQILMDHDYWDDVSDGVEVLSANVDKYIGAVWQTDGLNQTAMGIWMPRAEQVIAPTADFWGDTKQLATVTYGAKSPAYTGSGTANGETGMSPLVISIHGQAT